MTNIVLHPIAADYLERLRRASRRLPRGRRDELVAEIEAHLAEAVQPDATEADVRNVLDRLGEPEDIVEAERPSEPPTVRRRGTQEYAAVFLLLLGGFALGIGWVAGLIFLWGSRAWTTRDKWIGTLLVAGGLATTLFLLAAGAATLTAAAASLVVAPIVAAIYLLRRAGRPH